MFFRQTHFLFAIKPFIFIPLQHFTNLLQRVKTSEHSHETINFYTPACKHFSTCRCFTHFAHKHYQHYMTFYVYICNLLCFVVVLDTKIHFDEKHYSKDVCFILILKRYNFSSLWCKLFSDMHAIILAAHPSSAWRREGEPLQKLLIDLDWSTQSLPTCI